MKHLKPLLLSAAFASTLLAARAQSPADAPSDDPALAARVAQLETRLDRRERIAAALPKISGFVQLGYEWGDDNTSTLFVKRARVSLSGLLAPRLDYRLQFELAAPRLIDAYLHYELRPELQFKLGQYKVPFSIENTDYLPLRYEFIDYPLSLQRMMGFAEPIGGSTISATGRDMGFSLSGALFRGGRDFDPVTYDLGLYNGAGINTRDNNKSKDVSARLFLQPVRGLRIAGSCYWGEYGPEHLDRIRYGAGAVYDRGAVVVRGEWLGGRTGTPAADGTPRGRFTSSGWYAIAGWRIRPSLMPALRYDTLLGDTADRTTRQTNCTAALNWQPVKYLRCQFTYTREHLSAPGAKDRNRVMLLFSGSF